MNLGGTELTTKENCKFSLGNLDQPIWTERALKFVQKKRIADFNTGFYGYLISVGPVSGSLALVSVALLCYEKTASNIVHS